MSHRTSADSGETHGKYADEKSLDSGVLDSGFLSGVLDSASNLSECEDEPSGASAAVPRHALPELRETEYEYDEKIAAEQSYFDSGLILESDSGLCHETTPSAAAAEEEACKGDEQQLLTLLEDAFGPDEDGETTFHSAIAQGFIEVVFSLVRLAPSSKYLNVRNGSYLTPLHVAVLGAQPWAIRRLLIAGCNLTARDRSGNTALHLACKNGDLASVRCLMQPITSHEASVCPKPQPNDLPRIPQDLELRNDDGLTCIHVAARAGHFHVVRLLLIYGANVNVEDGTSGRTALHLCAEAGMAQMCQYLIRCGADPDIDSWDGHTPADFALIAGNPTLADELCRLGSSLSPPDESDEEDDDDESDADEGVLESEPEAFADG